MPIVGGVGTVAGPVLGAIVFATLQIKLLSIPALRDSYLFLYGGLLILVMLYEPKGLVGLVRRLVAPQAARRAAAGGRPMPLSRSSPSADLTKRFGGLARALRRLASTSRRARSSASSGRTAPARRRSSRASSAPSLRPRARSGFAGSASTASRTTPSSRRGLVRTHQIVRPFRDMTVEDERVDRRPLRRGAPARRRRRAGASGEILERTGLGARGAPSRRHADDRRPEATRDRARSRDRARVLCLDEVMGGLNPSEIVAAMSLIRRDPRRGRDRPHDRAPRPRRRGRHGPDPRPELRREDRRGRRRATSSRDPAVVAAYLGDETVRLFGACCSGRAASTSSTGTSRRVRDVSFRVEAGEIVTLIGANGAGKTTTLKTIAGPSRPAPGRILFEGPDLGGSPAHALASRGLVLVPEARQLWPGMTVLENLRMGAYPKAARPRARETLERGLRDVPGAEGARITRRPARSPEASSRCARSGAASWRGRASSSSTSRRSASRRSSSGRSSPRLRSIREHGVTVLLVEQNVPHALALADRAYVLEIGPRHALGPRADLARDDRIRDGYLGYRSA